jgi:6-phosphogluconolactonase (cycloisomerase 2 family)
VLASRHVTTYRIDGATGRLTMTADQLLGNAERIGGEPDGRFVYAAFGGYRGWQDPNRPDGSLVSYTAAPEDGSLVAASQATAFAYGSPDFSVTGWHWLDAGPGRVFVAWLKRWGTAYRHSTYTYASYPVGADGQFGTPNVRGLPDDEDPGQFALGARAGMVYKTGSYPSVSNPDAMGGITAHFVEADGHLTQTGWSDLCLASSGAGVPAVSARDVLFTRVYRAGQQRTCSFHGQRLAPHADLGPSFGAPQAVLDPAHSADPALVASSRTTPASSGQPARHELLLFALTPEGDPQQRDAVETFDAVGQVVFHPSGRFLYANVGTALWGYSIAADGRLTKVEDLGAGAGRMAITVPGTRTGEARHD